MLKRQEHDSKCHKDGSNVLVVKKLDFLSKMIHQENREQCSPECIKSLVICVDFILFCKVFKLQIRPI